MLSPLMTSRLIGVATLARALAALALMIAATTGPRAVAQQLYTLQPVAAAQGTSQPTIMMQPTPAAAQPTPADAPAL
jgi:hypothetical protein